jgi:hypothetical protein
MAKFLIGNLDIENCRGMILQERLYKFFELKNYTQLFTIQDEGDDSLFFNLKLGSPGNMDLLVMMYDKNLAREEVILRIYSKHTGQLRKQISIPVYPQRRLASWNSVALIEFFCNTSN